MFAASLARVASIHCGSCCWHNKAQQLNLMLATTTGEAAATCRLLVVYIPLVGMRFVGYNYFIGIFIKDKTELWE